MRVEILLFFFTLFGTILSGPTQLYITKNQNGDCKLLEVKDEVADMLDQKFGRTEARQKYQLALQNEKDKVVEVEDNLVSIMEKMAGIQKTGKEVDNSNSKESLKSTETEEKQEEKKTNGEITNQEKIERSTKGPESNTLEESPNNEEEEQNEGDEEISDEAMTNGMFENEEPESKIMEESPKNKEEAKEEDQFFGEEITDQETVESSTKEPESNTGEESSNNEEEDQNEGKEEISDEAMTNGMFESEEPESNIMEESPDNEEEAKVEEQFFDEEITDQETIENSSKEPESNTLEESPKNEVEEHSSDEDPEAWEGIESIDHLFNSTDTEVKEYYVETPDDEKTADADR